MLKYGLINTRYNLWLEVAEKLKLENIAEPSFWLDTRLYDKEFKQKYPNCVSVSLLDYNNWCKGLFLDMEYTNDKIQLPDNWTEIKDVIKLIFNRYDTIGQWRNLDMDASIMNIFVNLSRIWPKEKLDVIIFTETPHTPVDFMVYKICKIKQIPTLMLQQHNIVPVTMFKWDINGATIPLNNDYYEDFYYDKVINKIKSHFELICANEKHEPDYVKTLNKINDDKFKYTWNKINVILVEIWGNYKRKRTSRYVFKSYKSLEARVLDPLMAGIENLKIRKNISANFEEKFDSTFPTEDFLFFPLHYEPERTTVPDGGKYYDQLKAVVKLRERLDPSIPILVKEHFLTFSMALHGHHGRSPYFYDVIKALPNTYLIDYRLNTRKLMKTANWVATISGSTLYESVALGTPAIMFGHSWFENAPGIFNFEEIDFNKLNELRCNPEDLVDFLVDQIKKYSIPGAAHQSSLKNLKLYWGDKYNINKESDVLLDALKELFEKLKNTKN